MENPSVTLLYSDEKFEIWIDTEKENITLSMADRGITLLFTRDEWLEFQELSATLRWREKKRKRKRKKNRRKPEIGRFRKQAVGQES